MAASTAINPALVERFKSALDRLNPDGGKIGLAVSGGPDSMAMLLLAHEAIPSGFEVGTVDHGLRPEAKDECALVVAACEERGVPCEVLTVTIAEGNVQAKAREARYFALDLWAQRRGLAVVATAHHADDQAETLLMRLNRGSGVSGLAGVREYVWPLGHELPVIRPLLRFRRAELDGVIKTAGLTVAQDPSNHDDRFDRVRMRQALSEADWLDPLALSRSASHLAEADEALDSQTNAAVRDHVTRYSDRVECSSPPNRAIALRVIDRIIGWLGGTARGSQVADLLDKLERCEGGNVGGVLVTVEGKWGQAQPPRWVFRPEPPRRTG
ncbi:tRNA lysidine(34) synthetase TilS [Aurantiacibacter zhengii]|uniref:tRNA lysidine(34) synthetase TilS n=1 Tax=Aurantiacibacter zhengii TaxID=2307003 RepID=UPI0013143272|nr:tRNA lysidine(34) synthetase TilS [Aurantiacibacter zhengii]